MVGDVGKYFRGRSDVTLDEIKKELSPEQITEIIYSLEVAKIREEDGKIHFEYMELDEDSLRWLRQKREEGGLEDDDITVLVVVDGPAGRGKTYEVTMIRGVEEFQPYLKKG